MNWDYAFFEETLHRVRRLKALTYPYYITRAALEIGGGQLAFPPKIISKSTNDDEVIFETTSFARKGADNIEQLAKALANRLPEDFVAFHMLHSEALIVTRSYPIHLWSIEKILNEMRVHWRSKFSQPIRFFRFGDYFDRQAQYFGLWQERIDSSVWRVVVTDTDTQDEEYDTDDMELVYILGASFYEWLKDLVSRDGLPDPFIGVGPEGGFLDPV